MNNIVNISGYKFVDLPEENLQEIRVDLREKAQKIGLKGSIILAPEGINLCMAGNRDQINQFVEILESTPYFGDMWLKESFSDYQPFNKMLVKVKKETIPMGVDGIDPLNDPAPFMTPEELKKWYDEGRDMIVLDTRNPKEIKYGKFEDAVELDISHFRDFNHAIDELKKKYQDTPIVTYCTGGIRCEKAAPLMLKKGFKEVYQLEGGIINYFEKVGGDHWEGSCFVFDQRVALDPELNEINNIKE